MNRGSLFNEILIDDYFQQIREKVEMEIDAMPLEKLQREAGDLGQYFLDKYPVVVPTISNQVSMDELPRDEYASVIRAKLYIPFEGDGRLFHVIPRSSPLIYTPCKVVGKNLTAQMEIRIDNPDEFALQKDELLKQIDSGLDALRHAVPAWLTQIPEWTKEKVGQRRSALNRQTKFQEKISNIVPIRKRDDGTERIITPVKLKPPPLPTPQQRTAEEPVLAPAAYEDILKTIQSMVHVFERSPTVFREMEEEDLRTILLVGLNGLYEGGATGETFNGAGKTDILIRLNDRNVFIAECLIWKGEQVLKSKMDDQLFKYATWRDSKLAILVFNRNKGFAEVVAKMKATVKAHAQCVRELPFTHTSGARFTFRRADDAGKEFTLTCLAFDVPS